MYEKSGFEGVITYIQSGNVLFSSKNVSSSKIKKAIESAVEESFGFNVHVDVREIKEYKEIIKRCPYPEANDEGYNTKVLVSFLSCTPSQESLEELAKYAKPPERIELVNNVIYLFCPNGYGRSKLSNNFIESKLGLVATTRNLKTVRRLVELIE